MHLALALLALALFGIFMKGVHFPKGMAAAETPARQLGTLQLVCGRYRDHNTPRQFSEKKKLGALRGSGRGRQGGTVDDNGTDNYLVLCDIVAGRGA